MELLAVIPKKMHRKILKTLAVSTAIFCCIGVASASAATMADYNQLADLFGIDKNSEVFKKQVKKASDYSVEKNVNRSPVIKSVSGPKNPPLNEWFTYTVDAL